MHTGIYTVPILEDTVHALVAHSYIQVYKQLNTLVHTRYTGVRKAYTCIFSIHMQKQYSSTVHTRTLRAHTARTLLHESRTVYKEIHKSPILEHTVAQSYIQ